MSFRPKWMVWPGCMATRELGTDAGASGRQAVETGQVGATHEERSGGDEGRADERRLCDRDDGGGELKRKTLEDRVSSRRTRTGDELGTSGEPGGRW